MKSSSSILSDRRSWIRRLRWIVASLAVFVAGAIGPPWFFAATTEAGRRHMLTAVLNGIQVIHLAGGFAAAVASIALGAMLIRARKHRTRRPRLARVWLVCAAFLTGLICIESASTLWLVWKRSTPGLPKLPRSFDVATDLNEIDLAVIGGSSAFGYPYDRKLSVGAIVAKQLEVDLPSKRVRLDLFAEPGIHLERNHEKLAKARRKPDVLIVYLGHNEYTYRYIWSRSGGHYVDERRERPVGVLEELAGRWSSFCRITQEAVEAQRRSENPPPLVTRKLVDVPVCSPIENAELLVDFRRRLDAIVSWCDSLGTIAVLVVPPSNDADFEPNRSVLPLETPSGVRKSFARDFEKARSLEQANPNKSLRLYQELSSRFPEFAETHFRIGRLLLSLGRTRAAEREFILARDCDGLPMRCPTSFQSILREIAAKHGSILIDGPALFRSRSAFGLLDDDYLHDAHHPTLRGHVLLAEAILNALRERRALGLSNSSGSQALDPIAVAGRFGLTDSSAWIFVCEQERLFFSKVAYMRYDPLDRFTRALRYSQAVELIRAGKAPEESKIPGVGVKANRRMEAAKSIHGE